MRKGYDAGILDMQRLLEFLERNLDHLIRVVGAADFLCYLGYGAFAFGAVSGFFK